MRRLRSAALFAVLLFLAAPVGNAFASHDETHPFAGNWVTTYPNLTHGAINFRLVSDSQGASLLQALGGTPCPEPADYYQGTYTTTIDSGTHVGCSRTVPGTTIATLTSRYSAPQFEVLGSFEIHVSQSNPNFWNGSFAEDGSEGAFGDWSGSFVGHFSGDGSGLCPGASPSVRAAAAIGDVTVSSVVPDVQFRGPRDQQACALTTAVTLHAADELVSGPTGRAVLQFAGLATVTVEEGTRVKIGAFFQDGASVKIELLLAEGSVVADVKAAQPGLEFVIQSPTASATAHGTLFGMDHDPATDISLTKVENGVVEVQPLEPHDPYTEPQVPRGDSVTLNAAQEVQVSATATGAIAPIGESTPPTATPVVTTKAKAIGKVRSILRNNADDCDLKIKSVKAKAIQGGWRVTARVTLDGGRVRSAVWNVKGQSAPKAANALARKIQRGCP
jgi:hypothetical protein